MGSGQHQPALRLELGAPQQLLLGQQPLIELIDAGQALLDCRDHLLLEQGDLLFSIGLLDPDAPQRQAPPTQKDFLHGAERGFQQQEGIFLRAAER